jgi:hypothetical protein
MGTTRSPLDARDAQSFEGNMRDTLMVKVSGVFVLLSMAAEIAAIAVAAAHGTGPASMNARDWGVGEQLVFFQPHWMSILFTLGILAPCLSMLASLAMYSVSRTSVGRVKICGELGARPVSIRTVDPSAIIERQRGIEGYLLDESAAIWCVLLREQQQTWSWEGLSAGDYLEIGAFKGKSASILASFSRAAGNRLAVVDPEILPELRATLDVIAGDVEYLPIRSERLFSHEYYQRHHRSLAFAHVDGMHRFAAVQSDLRACEDMLSDFGILALDDFHSDLFPQIPAAVYRYLYSGVSDLSLFLVGFNKAYLCRNIAKAFFKKLVHERALSALENLGYRLSLVKNDRHDAFDAYSLVPWQGVAECGNEHGL